MSLYLSSMLLLAGLAVAVQADYQAEDCAITRGVVEANHAGYTGTGFVNTDNVTGSSIECTVSGPASSLTIRYASGTTTNRSMSLSPAGTTVNFPGTGAWTNWSTVTVPVSLGAGSHTLRLTATTANGGPNLDRLTVGEPSTGVINVSTAAQLTFRRSSADGIIRNSRISHTGLVQAGFGEGVYIGSAQSNFGCHGNSGGVDRSDRVQVLGNEIGPDVTAEHIDIKEGTEDGLVRGNTFNGTGISGANSGDSWVDVKGNNYLLEANVGTFAPPGTFANGYEQHALLSGYGCGNVWRDNRSDLGGVGAYAIRITAQSACSSNPNRVYSSNTVTNARSGLTNIAVTP